MRPFDARLLAMGEEAMPALLAASGHFSPTIRLPAVQALGRLLGDSRALMVLVSSLSETAHRGIVATAAEQALVEWGPMAAPPMVVLASQGAWPTRVRALRLLAKVGGPAQLSAVLGLRGERGRWPKWTLRWRGVALVRLLEDAACSVRLEAARLLGALGSREAAEYLKAALADGDELRRERAQQMWIYFEQEAVPEDE